MICLLGRWSVSAASLAAVVALTACAGSGSAVPTAPNQIPQAGFREFGQQLHAMTAPGSVRPALTCPKKYINCFTVSRTNGIIIDWCDGTSSNPCGDTSNYTWSGAVCHASVTTCAPIKPLAATWTGPFPCTASVTICGSTKGTYEVDTIKPGKHPPGVTKGYGFKQQILLSGASAGYIGLQVGP